MGVSRTDALARRSLRGDGSVHYCRLMAITPHIVVRDAERAVAFYREAFAAEELSRIPTPDGRLMSVQMRIGDGLLHLADEFPELGVLAPPSIGGTPVVLALDVPDAKGGVHPGGGGGRHGASAVAGGVLGRPAWPAGRSFRAPLERQPTSARRASG